MHGAQQSAAFHFQLIEFVCLISRGFRFGSVILLLCFLFFSFPFSQPSVNCAEVSIPFDWGNLILIVILLQAAD
jgi:hypothetical protein